MPYLSLTLCGFAVDLPPDAQVALSYRANDLLAGFESREASFSETFTLPLTAQNAQVLGLPHALDSQTTTPYRLLPARLTTPGGVVVLDGFAALELAGAEGYDITLTSAIGGLFATIGERSLHQLDLRALDHPLTYAEVAARQGSDYPAALTYPACDTGALTYRGPEQGLLYDELPAAVRVHALLLALLQAPLPPNPLPPNYVAALVPLAGYQLAGTLLEEPRYHDLVVPRATAYPQLRATYCTAYTCIAYTNALQTLTGSAAQPLRFDSVRQGALSQNSHYTPPPHAVGLRIELKLDLLHAGIGGTLRLYAERTAAAGGIPLVLHEELIPAVSAQTARAVALDLTFHALQTTAYSQLYWQWEPVPLFPSTLLVKPGGLLTITPLPRALAGAPVHAEAGLPDLKQAELLKLVFNAFNVLVVIDQANRVIRLDLFNELERNRSRAVDWSGKLDISQRPKLAYRLAAYAQRNHLAYADGPAAYVDVYRQIRASDERTTGRAVLLARNTSLPPDAEGFQAEFALPLAHATPSGPLCWLPLLTDAPALATLWDSTRAYHAGPELVYYQGDYWQCTAFVLPTSKPPLAGEYLPRAGTLPEWVRAPAGSFAQPRSEGFAAVARLLPHVNARVTVRDELRQGATFVPRWELSREGLAFPDLLADYYAGLSAILDRVRVLTVAVRLSAFDIDSLDFTRPVRLALPHVPGYGALDCLAYVSLIDQYQPASSGSVAVTLLVLGEPVPGLAPPMPNPPVLPATLLRVLATELSELLSSEDGRYLTLEI